MNRSEHSQSVSDFKAHDAETLERINATGNAEVLTQDGKARAVLLSPEVFDALVRDAELARRAAMIRQGIDQHQRGEYRDGFAALEDIKQKIRDGFGA